MTLPPPRSRAGNSPPTAVQWAVLSAYARSLPVGPSRVAVRQCALHLRPQIGCQAAALATAAALGYTDRANITVRGKAAARRFLVRFQRAGMALAPPSKEDVPLTPHSRTLSGAWLADRYLEIVAFYDRFLGTPEGVAAPKREAIVQARNVLQGLADGEPLTESAQAYVVTGLRHLHSGILAGELGYSGPSLEEEEAALIVLRDASEKLAPYAEAHSPLVQKVVERLGQGVVPNGRHEMGMLLALIMQQMPGRSAPPPTPPRRHHA